MSDSKEWRAEEINSTNTFSSVENWQVVQLDRSGGYVRTIARDLDKPTAHKIAAVNEYEAALEETAEQLELLANMLSMPTESAAPKSDRDSVGTIGVLQRARAALAKGRPPE